MQLPFELASLPQKLFHKFNLRVVSYALPALIAIGQLRHHMKPTWFFPLAICRDLAVKKTLRLLRQIQPDSGGYLEATPLTSFVLMSLAEIKAHQQFENEDLDAVITLALTFIKASCRSETLADGQAVGSWAIDTDLATWGTTLSVTALSEKTLEQAGIADQRQIVQWLLKQQYLEIHPYTLAAPGGWAWTDKPGGVPDSDDTSGAILALNKLSAIFNDRAIQRNIESANHAGQKWLDGLQNKDGGIPTFCRGWGKLPFDRSCSDITAHRLRALLVKPDFTFENELDHVKVERLVYYLLDSQYSPKGHYKQLDGSWAPLWFGNQSIKSTDFPKLDVYEANRVYGTSRVLVGLVDLLEHPDVKMFRLLKEIELATFGGINWLLKAQQACGGYSGTHLVHADSSPRALTVSIEETALAIEALGRFRSWWLMQLVSGVQGESVAEDSYLLKINAAIESGTQRLSELTEGGHIFPASPIGLYFARLWYHERLYPKIFTVAALNAVTKRVDADLT